MSSLDAMSHVGHMVSHLRPMTNHRQQYVWSLSWNHSHEEYDGGGKYNLFGFDLEVGDNIS